MIFLTGASGVVGREILPLIPAERLISGRHRTSTGGKAREVAIDIRQEKLGLSMDAYRALCHEVTVVLHCAAITDMSKTAPGVEETNIEGVRNIIALARDANAALHYVSTAYCSEAHVHIPPEGSAYIETKRAAETLVRQSDVEWTMIRPSIVAGHSTTGAIASFQGFHLFIAAMLKGRMQIIPLEPSARCDFVPADIVAAGIAQITQAPVWGRTYWLTAGAQALTIEDMIEVGQPFARRMGRDLSMLTLMAPDEMQREILPSLPRRLRERVEMLIGLSSVMATPAAFPSDTNTILGPGEQVSSASLKQCLAANIRYWADAQGQHFPAGHRALV
ncbi:MAG: SDR family oxidoreductase [Pseudomonadota bacterium]